MTNWIVGPRHDAINAVAAVAAPGIATSAGTSFSDVGGARLDPLPLLDGNYALPAQVRTDSRYVAAHSILNSWSLQSSVTNFVRPTSDPGGELGTPVLIPLNDRLLTHGGLRGSLTMPASNVFRLESGPWGVGRRFGTDFTNEFGPRRRSVLTAFGPLAASLSAGGETNNLARDFTVGQTHWVSFCWIPGTANTKHVTKAVTEGGLRNANGINTSKYLNQGDSIYSTADPYFPTGGVGRNGGVGIYTTGPASEGGVVKVITNSPILQTWGTYTTDRYEFPTPSPGTLTHFVLKIRSGPTGELQVWINGINRVNVTNTPIGNYDYYTGKLFGLEMGTYTWDGAGLDVVYYANLEYGTTSLLERVASPLSVPNLNWTG